MSELPWKFRELLGYDGKPVNEDKAILMVKEFGVDSKDTLNETPLTIAAMLGRVKTIKWLLENGAKVDYIAPESDNMSALLHACEQKRFEAVKILIENNADTESSDKFGNTALAITFTNCFTDPLPIADFLISNGAAISDRVREQGNSWNKELFQNFLKDIS